MGLKHFKCPRGDTVTGARESAGKRAGTPETRRCGYVGVWGTGGTLLVLSGALILTGTRPAGAAAYQRQAGWDVR